MESRAPYMGENVADKTTIGVRDGRPGWYRVYNHVLDEYGARMGPHGIAVYNALCRYANSEHTSYPSHDKIAEITGMSRRQVMREIKNLVDLALVGQDARKKNNLKQSNIYTILDIPRCATQSHRCDTQSHRDVTDSHIDDSSTRCATQSHKQDLDINKTYREEEDKHPSSIDPVFARLQDEWMTVNPGQLENHRRLVERYGFDNWLRGFDACKRAARSSVAYVEKVVIGQMPDTPAPKKQADPNARYYITDPVTGQQKEVTL